MLNTSAFENPSVIVVVHLAPLHPDRLTQITPGEVLSIDGFEVESAGAGP